MTDHLRGILRPEPYLYSARTEIIQGRSSRGVMPAAMCHSRGAGHRFGGFLRNSSRVECSRGTHACRGVPQRRCWATMRREGGRCRRIPPDRECRGVLRVLTICEWGCACPHDRLLPRVVSTTKNRKGITWEHSKHSNAYTHALHMLVCTLLAQMPLAVKGGIYDTSY